MTYESKTFMSDLVVEVSVFQCVCVRVVVLRICPATLSEMNCVLSHARNAPSVSTHPLTCPTTYYCLDSRQNAAFKWFSDVEVKTQTLYSTLHFFFWIAYCTLSVQETLFWRLKRIQKENESKFSFKWFCFNKNENIRFAESLKSDWTRPSEPKAAAADHSNRVSGLTVVSAAPSRTACLLWAHVGGRVFQTQESCWRDEFLCLSWFLQHLTCALNTPARKIFFFFFEDRDLAVSWCQTLGFFEFRHPIKKKKKEIHSQDSIRLPVGINMMCSRPF